MIRLILPAHLRTLAGVTGEVEIEIHPPATQRSVLDALEARYPRRPFVRFFGCGEDLSHQPPDALLPEAVASGAEPLVVLGAIAGG